MGKIAYRSPLMRRRRSSLPNSTQIIFGGCSQLFVQIASTASIYLMGFAWSGMGFQFDTGLFDLGVHWTFSFLFTFPFTLVMLFLWLPVQFRWRNFAKGAIGIVFIQGTAVLCYFMLLLALK
jgi:hypothetical protein